MLTFTPADISQFVSSGQHYEHWSGLLNYTDGVQFLCLNGCGWLVDLIAAQQPYLKGSEFQSWLLKVADTKGEITVVDEPNGEPLYRYPIQYTDFPLATLRLYVSDGILMLANEY